MAERFARIRPLAAAIALLFAASLAWAGSSFPPDLPPILPVSTSSGAASVLVAKASAGKQMSVYATNLTSTAGFLVGYNATSAPADGALTSSLVVECIPLASGSVASINDQPGPATTYSVGITYILTSASTCYTKTTGSLTGFIKAKVQ